MTDHSPDRFADSDAAYVLGMLDDHERAEFEQHLAGCPACATRVESLQALPDVLGRLDLATVQAAFTNAGIPEAGISEAAIPDAGIPDAGIPEVGTPDTADEPPPDLLLPRLLRRVHAERRRRRLSVVAAAGAAACLVALALLLGVRLGDSGSGTPAGRSVAMAQVGAATGLTATARVAGVDWGTRIELRCHEQPTSGYPAGYSYVLVARLRDGSSEQLGTWTAPPGRDTTFVTGIAGTPDRIGTLVITDAAGAPVLQASL